MTQILLVEDEPLIAMDIAGTLEDLGYPVEAFAHTHAEAISRLSDMKPDLVILDVNLAGGREGLDIATRIRAERGTPIIFVTGHTHSDIITFARDLGRTVVARKPVDSQALASALQTVLAA